MRVRCQNWHLSKSQPEPEKSRYIDPVRMVELAVAERCQGLSVSFTEPLMLFEYSLDVFPIARRRGLYNNYVSNGYMTLDTLLRLREAGMDAIKFDVKGGVEAVKRFCGADVNVVWRNAAEAKRLGLHVEIVNLVVQAVNDDESCLREVIESHLHSVGPHTPLHFTGYYPAYRFQNPSTPVETLEKAYEMAKRQGVQYPYIGNVPGHRYENTYCPSCGETLIKRHGFSVVNISLSEDKRCIKCREEIPLVGNPVMRKSFLKL